MIFWARSSFAFSSRFSRRSLPASTSSAAAGFGPGLLGTRPASPPRSRCSRHFVSSELYNPSRRSSALIAPGPFALSASARMRALYSAL